MGNDGVMGWEIKIPIMGKSHDRKRRRDGAGNQIPIMDLEMRTETGTIDEKETGAGYQIPKVIQELWRRGRGGRNSHAGDGNEDYTPIVALGTGDQIPNYGDK
mmetsp:Transcript_33534/g.33774  ORF Transcript_33534/g.33774 Transcript_33534/m.33774 type:complete len:103 (+) Transcript_33534:133-441(+)